MNLEPESCNNTLKSSNTVNSSLNKEGFTLNGGKSIWILLVWLAIKIDLGKCLYFIPQENYANKKYSIMRVINDLPCSTARQLA